MDNAYDYQYTKRAYLSRGKAINATITTKNNAVCIKNPFVVGHPTEDAICTNLPKTICVNLYVSGFAIKKNTNAL
jgi:hypothetical protein